MSGDEDRRGPQDRRYYAAVRPVDLDGVADTVSLRVEKRGQEWQDVQAYVDEHPGTAVFKTPFPERPGLGEHIDTPRAELQPGLKKETSKLEARLDAGREYIVARFDGRPDRIPQPGDPVRFTPYKEIFEQPRERTVRAFRDHSVANQERESQHMVVRKSPHLDGLGWAQSGLVARPQAYERAEGLNQRHALEQQRHHVPDPLAVSPNIDGELRRLAQQELWRQKDVAAVREQQPMMHQPHPPPSQPPPPGGPKL